MVPVVTPQELPAVVTLLGGSRREAYEEADLQALALLVSQAAIALEYRVTVASPCVRSRWSKIGERIARELHDGVIQAIFGVGLNLQAAAAITSDEVTAKRLDDAVGRLDDAVRDLRNYVFGLRPGMLADLQLDRAIRRLVADLEAASGITFTLDVDPAAAALLAGRGPEVLAVVNELLSNLRRHSDATMPPSRWPNWEQDPAAAGRRPGVPGGRARHRRPGAAQHARARDADGGGSRSRALPARARPCASSSRTEPGRAGPPVSHRGRSNPAR